MLRTTTKPPLSRRYWRSSLHIARLLWGTSILSLVSRIDLHPRTSQRNQFASSTLSLMLGSTIWPLKLPLIPSCIAVEGTRPDSTGVWSRSPHNTLHVSPPSTDILPLTETSQTTSQSSSTFSSPKRSQEDHRSQHQAPE